MEGREGMNSSGVTVVGSDAPSEYHVAPRTETHAQVTGSAAAVTAPLGVAPSMLLVTVKKKRGRPRKYGPDGTVARTLSPKPISSAGHPPVIDFSSEKKPKFRPAGSGSKHHLSKTEMGRIGDWVSCSVGANFTPHIITVNAGEDVTMKVISFSQQGPRAICVLSANGVISSVTLRQPDSSGGTLTYEGRFEILSLSGSFMESESSGGVRNRTGGMSVSLASPDGRVVGGGIAGLLVAASPVQIVVGSFLTGNQLEQKSRKPKLDATAHAIPAAAAVAPIPNPDVDEPYGTAAAKPNLSSSSFRAEWSSYPTESRPKPTDINVTLHRQ